MIPLPLAALLLSLPNAGVEASQSLYVEARSASVFAGACHFNGEYVTQGRELIAGWRLGAEAGAELEGVEVVAAVAGDRNLQDEGVVRRSVVYLDLGLDEARARAALGWLKAEHAALLGTLVEVRLAEVSVRRAGDAFAVRAGDGVGFEGAALPDRACCTMPSQVWYRPEVPLAERLVGHVGRFRLVEPRLKVATQRHDENSAFVGAPRARP